MTGKFNKRFALLKISLYLLSPPGILKTNSRSLFVKAETCVKKMRKSEIGRNYDANHSSIEKAFRGEHFH